MTDQQKRAAERFVPHQVQFVGEQDGAPERDLKDRLSTTLRNMGVRKAYLAVVTYDARKGPQTVSGGTVDGGDTSVALCMTLQDGAADKQEIVQRASHEFASMFGASQRMDIIFLTDQQELSLGKVCRPFYMKMEEA